jgi:hypothetical protein
MERKLLLIAAVAICSIFFLSSPVEAQAGDVMVVDNVIKVNPRHPPQPRTRYISNNARKKKLRVKLQIIASWNCPTYLHYESKPQKKREKLIRKRRKKL